MSGLIAAAIAAHVPTLGLAQNTPDYQQNLVDAEHTLGDALRALQPDLWVIVSSHWVATFDWPVGCQPRHTWHCVADEAPQLLPGSPYDYAGDPEFAGALVVDAILYNRATFSQPFPLLELRFADLNGSLIASRRFKPAEYLSGELAGVSEMPSQTPIHISLDILDPGNRAVNYSLSFHSPE